MSIELFWEDDAKTILRFNFVGGWTWDDYYPLHEQGNQMAQAIPHIVHSIVDLRQNRSVPTNTITHLTNIANRQIPNAGLKVIITNNRFLHILHSTGVKIDANYARYFQVVSCEEDAHECIAQAKMKADELITT